MCRCANNFFGVSGSRAGQHDVKVSHVLGLQFILLPDKKSFAFFEYRATTTGLRFSEDFPEVFQRKTFLVSLPVVFVRKLVS